MRTLAFFLVAALALGAGAGELVIAERGRPAAYSIVRAAQASACEKYAAEELRDFLARVTGVQLPIVTDAEALPAKAIVVGETKFTAQAGLPEGIAVRLGEDGFALQARENRLFVFGSKKRGVLYGVYEVLEKYAGCRWYASWHSVIPRRARVAVPDALSDVQVPAFLMREPFWFDLLQHGEFAARLRANSRSWRSNEEKYGGMPFRFGGGLGSCHTFNVLMPPDEFFDKHPEYYSFENGARVKHPSQLCLTNPDVLRIVTERVLERIRRDPHAKFYGVSQNDWYHYCQCEKCKAVDAEEESHAGTMIRFVNAVAERVEKEFPNAIIETLAYQYTRKPPKKTRLRHNVVPCLCTIECDFARSIDESPCKENVSFRDDIRGWAKQTDQLYVWDYTTNFRNYALPFPNVLALQGNVRFFRDNNVKELFEQGAYQGRHGDFAELKSWLLAKWMWNPELPVEPLLKDFFEGYYGKAAPFVRAYFDELHARQLAWSSSPRHPLGIFADVDNPALPDDFYDKYAPVWDQALAAVKDDPATSYNVRMAAFAFNFGRLEMMRIKGDKALWLSSKPIDRSTVVTQRGLAKYLLDCMAEAKDIRLAEGMERHDQLVAGWKSLAARTNLVAHGAVTNATRGEVQDVFLSIANRGSWGDFVDDPLASDGRALKLSNTHYEWCTRLDMNRIEFEPGAKFTVRVRARCEKAGEGEAFWAGVYDPIEKVGRGGIEPKTSEVGPEYAWYDVCTWVPNQQEYLWIGPGRFDKNGKSSIKGLWIDKVEFVKVK